jgi:hypothetical protein
LGLGSTGPSLPPRRPGHSAEGVIQVLRVEHSPAAVDQLVAQIATLEPDPAEVWVVLETRHGLLVERLLDAGYVACRPTRTWSPASRDGQAGRPREDQPGQALPGGPGWPATATWPTPSRMGLLQPALLGLGTRVL